MTEKPHRYTLEEWIDNAGDGNKQASRWFGQFIAFYADVEGQCHILFRRHCGIKEKVSRSISGGMRLADLLPILSVVIAESDMAAHGKEDFPLCIEQLNHLTAFRHRLVHRGFSKAQGLISGEMGNLTSSNVLTAKARESMEVLEFHVNHIKAAAMDSLRIHTRMQFMTIDQPNFRQTLTQPFEQELYGPWLYKPVQPKKLVAKRPETPQ